MLKLVSSQSEGDIEQPAHTFAATCSVPCERCGLARIGSVCSLTYCDSCLLPALLERKIPRSERPTR